jgi:hypothetical protein
METSIWGCQAVLPTGRRKKAMHCTGQSHCTFRCKRALASILLPVLLGTAPIATAADEVPDDL